MAKTTAPKTPAKSSAAGKGKSKRTERPAPNAGVTTTAVPSTFPMAAGAFTVEQPPDPGPKRARYTFAKIPHVLEIPNLIELQKASFDWFKTEGLGDAFASISPIKDFTGNLILEFGEHSLGEPKYSIEECRERDMTYSAPLRVRVRLITAESGEIKGIPDQEIFMGDFPLMTDKGTFMINGAERVIVSQLVRSPGVYYSQDVDTNARPTYNATIIPNRGAWIEFETDNGTKNDETEGTIGVRIDKNRKIYVSTFIRALSRPDLGLNWESDEAILALFDDSPLVQNSIDKDKDIKTREDALKEIYKKLRPGEPENAENAEKLLESLFFDEKRYDLAGVGRYKLTGKFHYRIENPDVEDRITTPSIAINEYAGLDEPSIDVRCLTRSDMIAVIRRSDQSRHGHHRQGRHRSPRQPPRAFGRRTAAEPVPRRFAASRARRARAHDGSGHRNGHAAGADQHPSGRRCDQGVLRVLATLAVHGPDQLPGRTDPQAPSLGARAGRSVTRTRGLRSSRRPSLALRPHLPDRNAGRPEHRSDRLACDLCARQ